MSWFLTAGGSSKRLAMALSFGLLAKMEMDFLAHGCGSEEERRRGGLFEQDWIVAVLF